MTSRIEQILHDARRRKVFSGAAWSCGTADSVEDSGVVGTLAWDGPPATKDSWWDLASVTKPIVGLAVMALVDTGRLALDDTVADHLPHYAGTDKATLTVRQLLTHTSGIPGQTPLYRWCPSRDKLLEAIRTIALVSAPGTTVHYSSAGFIILGMMAEAASGLPLDKLVSGTVTAPVGMSQTMFTLPPELRWMAAATEDCPWRGRLVQGTVHDENAEVLGGICGHAGLFAPLTDLEALGRMLCAGGQRGGATLLSPAALAVMTTPATDQLNLRRSLAWQGRDGLASPAGELAGALSYGHTGFTGTSIWVDPDAGRYVVLLTNRVHPSRLGPGIARTRTLVHNTAFGSTSTAGDTAAGRQ
ncbi:MAG: serine hydrolase domain-containing protein [Nakamurella sp.]